MAKGARKAADGVKHSKANLPQKPCAACGRPFVWRKNGGAIGHK